MLLLTPNINDGEEKAQNKIFSCSIVIFPFLFLFLSLHGKNFFSLTPSFSHLIFKHLGWDWFFVNFPYAGGVLNTVWT